MRTRSKERFQRAVRAARIGDAKEAEAIARPLLEHHPASTAVHMLFGMIKSSAGELEAAAEHYRRAIELNPGNVEAHNNLGVVYRRLGRSADAFMAVEEAIELAPDRADVYYNYGNVQKQLGEFHDAREAYERALELNPDFPMAYNNLGNLLEEQGEHEAAITIFRRGLQYDPNHPKLHYNLGIALEREGEFEEAAAEYQDSLRHRPGWTDALNNLGITYQRLERYDQAIHAFEEMLELEPEHPTALNNTATLLAQQGRSSEALDYYKRALKRRPDYYRAIENLGSLLEHYDNAEQAVEELHSLAATNPENLSIRLHLARRLLAHGSKLRALRHLEYVFNNRSDDPEHLAALAALLMRAERRDMAATCIGELRQIAPDIEEFRLELAEAYRDAGELRAAERELDAFLDAAPDDVRARKLLAEIYLETGRAEEAVELLEHLKARDPEDGEVLGAITRAHQALGRREQAIEAADALVNLQGRRARPEDLNRLNESLSLYEKAVQAFEQDHGEAWAENLERLRAVATGDHGEHPDEYRVDELGGMDEESVPILDFDFDQAAEEEGIEDEELADESEEAPEEQVGVGAPFSVGQESAPAGERRADSGFGGEGDHGHDGGAGRSDGGAGSGDSPEAQEAGAAATEPGGRGDGGAPRDGDAAADGGDAAGDGGDGRRDEMSDSHQRAPSLLDLAEEDETGDPFAGMPRRTRAMEGGDDGGSEDMTQRDRLERWGSPYEPPHPPGPPPGSPPGPPPRPPQSAVPPPPDQGGEPGRAQQTQRSFPQDDSSSRERPERPASSDAPGGQESPYGEPAHLSPSPPESPRPEASPRPPYPQAEPWQPSYPQSPPAVPSAPSQAPGGAEGLDQAGPEGEAGGSEEAPEYAEPAYATGHEEAPEYAEPVDAQEREEAPEFDEPDHVTRQEEAPEPVQAAGSDEDPSAVEADGERAQDGPAGPGTTEPTKEPATELEPELEQDDAIPPELVEEPDPEEAELPEGRSEQGDEDYDDIGPIQDLFPADGEGAQAGRTGNSSTDRAAPEAVETGEKSVGDVTDGDGRADRTGAPAESSFRERQASMLEYLSSLAEQLPPDKVEQFQSSDVPLRIERLKNVLQGKRGLRYEAERYRRSLEEQRPERRAGSSEKPQSQAARGGSGPSAQRPQPGPGNRDSVDPTKRHSQNNTGSRRGESRSSARAPTSGKSHVSPDSLSRTFGVLAGLTRYIPNKWARTALGERISRILNRLGGTRESDQLVSSDGGDNASDE